MLVLFAIGGCFVEANAGAGMWRSHTASGFLAQDGYIEDQSHSPSFDVGFVIGVAVDYDAAGFFVGVGASHDRGRERNATIATAQARIDGTLYRAGTYRVRGTVVRQARSGPRGGGGDSFFGVTVARRTFAASLGYRWARMDAENGKKDAATYIETREGVQMRIVWWISEWPR